MEIDTIISNLNFESNSDLFEKAMEDLGKALGFESIRPDKENNEGPDNLWKIDDQNYLVIECKNRVDPNRTFIIRSEAGKMSIYIAWFKRNYPGNGKFVMIYPKQKMLDKGVFFEENVSVTRSGKLKILLLNLVKFYQEFQGENFNSLSTDIIEKRLVLHGLSNINILNDYNEPIITHKATKIELTNLDDE
jgi:hypothetical protein